MKFTSEELAKLLGIKIGDKIRFSNGEIADVVECYLLDFHPYRDGIWMLIDEDFEIVKPKKKVGDLICKDVECPDCPLNAINCGGFVSNSLYYILEQYFKSINDSELYDILKARLDKEIEE